MLCKLLAYYIYVNKFVFVFIFCTVIAKLRLTHTDATKGNSNIAHRSRQSFERPRFVTEEFFSVGVRIPSALSSEEVCTGC
jgi:hypothetical protein